MFKTRQILGGMGKAGGWVEQEGALNLGTIIVVGVGGVAVCYCCCLLLLFDGWVEQEGV